MSTEVISLGEAMALLRSEVTTVRRYINAIIIVIIIIITITIAWIWCRI